MSDALQWGGRFTAPPDPALLAFGSSLAGDLLLAPFDVRTSLAHVAALEGGAIVEPACARALRDALTTVAQEIASGAFATWAATSGAEDVHGAIDARVRELDAEAGAFLHAGRSRNDQVATTLALYANDRAQRGVLQSISIARTLVARAEEELEAQTLLAGTTHWQPAQPVLLAFWLAAAAEPFARAARTFVRAREDAKEALALGSGALAGSTLPLDREAARLELGFAHLSRNALDAVGTRDAVLDVAHGYVRAVAAASRVCEELIVWATPAFGYVRLGDASSTGSSLMPQKRNPDTFELVRGGARELLGSYTGAVGTTIGLPLSYNRDLQQTKRIAMQTIERGAAMLDAFERALRDTTFVRDAMQAHAGEGYTVATDIADALVRDGASAREAHARVGAMVREAEAQGADLPMDPAHSVHAKATPGSTGPRFVRDSLRALSAELTQLADA